VTIAGREVKIAAGDDACHTFSYDHVHVRSLESMCSLRTAHSCTQKHVEWSALTLTAMPLQACRVLHPPRSKSSR